MSFSFFILITDFFLALMVGPLMKKCGLIHLTCPRGYCCGTFWDHCNLTACTASSRMGLALINFESYGAFLLILVEQGGRCISFLYFILSLAFFCARRSPFWSPMKPVHPFSLHRTSWAVSQFTRAAKAKPACTWWQHSITDDDIITLIMSLRLHFHDCYNIRIFSLTVCCKHKQGMAEDTEVVPGGIWGWS